MTGNGRNGIAEGRSLIRDLIGEDQSLEIFGFEEIDIACTEKKSNRAWATKTYFPNRMMTWPTSD